MHSQPVHTDPPTILTYNIYFLSHYIRKKFHEKEEFSLVIFYILMFVVAFRKNRLQTSYSRDKIEVMDEFV
jgi:uncharacterized membrane protein